MMTQAIHLKYKKVPLFSFLRMPFYAFWGKSKVFHGKESIPPITVQLDGIKINRAHLSQFNKICDVKNNKEVSLIYPITIIFPFFGRILSLKQAPLSMFSMLGRHLKIIQYRQIGIDEAFDIFCEISQVRIVSKGLEIDLSGVIKIKGETVWTATETFFYRGVFGAADTDVEETIFEAIPKAKVIGKWFLPGGNGFRFARISGDGNGLHYSKFYARLFGFERDFAQPFLILGNAIKHLINNEENSLISLNVTFKGPFYYERDVTIKGMKTNNKNRFDIYSEGNDRPCISGVLNN